MLLFALSLAASSYGADAPAEAEGTATERRIAVPVPSVDDMIHKTPNEIFAPVERRLRAAEHAPRPRERSVDELVRDGLTGGTMPSHTPVDLTPVNAEATMAAAERARYRASQRDPVEVLGIQLSTLAWICLLLAGVALGWIAAWFTLGARTRRQ